MPIQILPAQLANQIAAGEVVERPASVIKELVENSLDAGADRIEVEVDKGGHKRILIRDNGSGIGKQELTLALSRHATSKIHCLDDLEQIISLGFRGEALASISSVSRLTLTSKPQAQPEAWQAIAEGRDMRVRLIPAAHPDGTSVEVLDLFFNTPARRKFLRTEKTEFQHIDEVIRRIALSRFDTAFSLKHNGKLLRQYPKAASQAARQKRVALVCGQGFAQQALTISSELQGLSLHGWLSLEPASQPDQQYFYVNGRMMRDKLIHHAIRQAFEGWLPQEAHPAFVLYLTLDAREVDVNVHPAKHEVRFHQARLVHDFIFRALQDALEQPAPEQTPATLSSTRSVQVAEPRHDYIRPLQSKTVTGTSRDLNGSRQPVASRAVKSYQQLVTSSSAPRTQEQWLLIRGRYLLLSAEDNCYLVPLYRLERNRLANLLDHEPVSQPLLMPVAIPCDETLAAAFSRHQEALPALALDIQMHARRLLVKQVPAGLRQHDWSTLLPPLLSAPAQHLKERLLELLANAQKNYTAEQAATLWQWHSDHEDPEITLKQWGRRIPLEDWLHD
ncbi:DNA mismatch repair endonuclease MutL [Bowmanella dokdonensis]|uniref:DNA mismatch repair protein MutL n=1 Tax=Bowmanella dokdonensis TaxID=751969 RepID=A0A939IPR4_9ALTE|nr:DNA mismatch repair endonuclease MutL [Bowmanella dokdonensis]MBN7823711.1 DNA mismatch repair endonuclease MutL [Bowmanella dokdonensis]